MTFKIKGSYHKSTIAEPLILEREEWAYEEWKTLCKLCGLPFGPTERIVLHANLLECFENPENQVIDDHRTYIVTEVCPHCESQIEMRWNTDTQGFKAFCPVCGERLMLCDECRHADCGPCDYDSQTDSCQHNLVTLVPNEIPPAFRV